MGTISIKPYQDVERRNVELGYWIGENHWSKGITTHVIQLFVEYIWENFAYVNRIQAFPFATNEASKKVLMKNGFVLEAVLKNYFFKNEVFVDANLFVKFKC